jgi:hypothetical protein
MVSLCQADEKPLITIYDAITSQSNVRPTFKVDKANPLLIIYAVQNKGISQDKKSVWIQLKPADAKKYSEIIKSHLNDLIIIQASDQKLAILTVTGPTNDGYIEFPFSASEVAKYLKERLKIN